MVNHEIIPLFRRKFIRVYKRSGKQEALGIKKTEKADDMVIKNFRCHH